LGPSTGEAQSDDLAGEFPPANDRRPLPEKEKTMAIYGTRFDPFRDMLALQDSLVRAFDATYGRNRAAPAAEEKEAPSGGFTPAVDVFEDQDGLQLLVELPGVDLKDIDVRVEGNTLTIRGERKLERTERQGYRLVERVYGSFFRSFTLPQTVDAEAVAADAKDGVLHVRLPKKPESKPRQIKVQIDPARTVAAPAQKQ
jgi:HSP20 family protein